MTDSSLETTPAKVPRVGVIAGSTRPGANSAALAQWVHQLCVSRGTGCEYELISLRDWNLPLLDGPGVPAHTGPTLPHSKAWSDKVSSLQGFVFVTPQYNWGYPAPLKNALDYLFKEWNGKPGLVITFGGRGGGKCSAQLKEVLQGLQMKVVDSHPGITLERSHIDSSLTLADAEKFYGEKYSPEIMEAATQLERLLQPPRESDDQLHGA